MGTSTAEEIVLANHTADLSLINFEMKPFCPQSHYL